MIATNTTIDRAAVAELPHADEAGGLSGRPLGAKATAVIRTLAEELGGALPIIGVGGIMSGADAKEKIAAGATLVQIYTGLIYKGPELVAEIAAALRQTSARRDAEHGAAASAHASRCRTSPRSSPSCW